MRSRTLLAVLPVLVAVSGCGQAPEDPQLGAVESEVRRCGGRRVDVRTDPNNCGRCGQACGPKGVCSDGKCHGECKHPGDPSCQPACPTGDLQCGAQCCAPLPEPPPPVVLREQDATPIPSCDPTGQACACGGDPALVPCPTATAGELACVDLSRDRNNCGGCGIVCPQSGPSCINGICQFAN